MSVSVGRANRYFGHKSIHKALVCMPFSPVFSRHTRELPHFMDEPMNGLDNQGGDEVCKLLLQMKVQGKTILLASHNSEDIRILCDAVYEMDGGNLKSN